MSPDALPWWWPVLALLLWLLVLAAHRRERHATPDHDSRRAVDRVVTESGEHRAANDPVQREERDSEDDKGNQQREQIHARIVSCQCLGRTDRLDGLTCPHSR